MDAGGYSRSKLSASSKPFVPAVVAVQELQPASTNAGISDFRAARCAAGSSSSGAVADAARNDKLDIMDCGVDGKVLIDQMKDELKDETVPESVLQEMFKQGVLHLIPRNEDGELTSVGSMRHHEQGCTPCLFWFRNTCAKSIQCGYCHFVHKEQKTRRIRPSKKTRQLMKEADEIEMQERIVVESAIQGECLDKAIVNYEPAGLPLTRINPEVLTTGDARALDTALQMKNLGGIPQGSYRCSQPLKDKNSTSMEHDGRDNKVQGAPARLDNVDDGFHTPRSDSAFRGGGDSVGDTPHWQ
eukprot:gnl/TRDRNA2_/TRDRNA2_203594_c0_seq1.p1 gnl/TRDRNA2_/TRDRNA2_203594_c0~~gnl/TRDRNA2_/TRDRNA2_203594_c0_seq1.p1  ORF type:complete len:322 (-),score=48.06 gnl/TRDRNA2_/TRDRNA2_203594_c0_seq1:93-992(-)